MFFGLPYAVGVVGIMVLHEGGHALVMLQRGIPVGATTFIPFVGASVSMKERPKDAYESALVAFGGPVLGGIGAAGVALAGVAMNSQVHPCEKGEGGCLWWCVFENIEHMAHCCRTDALCWDSVVTSSHCGFRVFHQYD